MSGTELIMGMGEVINYLKELEEKNKKLEEENKDLNFSLAGAREVRKRLDHAIKKLEEENKKLKEEKFVYDKEVWSPVELHRILDNYDLNWNEVCEEVNKLKEKNKKLKEEKQKYQPKGSRINHDGFHDYMKQEIDKIKNKLNVSEIKRTEAEGELESFQEFTMEYNYEDTYNGWLRENHEHYYGTWLDNWCSEHLDKYEGGDDWDWGYGFTIKDGQYRITMAGGGDHWEYYVITKNGCFIHNKEGMKKVFTFVSCPEGNYIKVWDTPDMEGGLVLDDGETNMYEMVKESYEEEIMNFTSD